MIKFQLRKGNLYNGLINKIDSQIIDSDQYDLEVIVHDEIHYYRVRFFDGYFDAQSIPLTAEEFSLPPFSKPCTVMEAASFCLTDFYKESFPYRSAFALQRTKEQQRHFAHTHDYFVFLQNRLQKNRLHGERIYDFSLPAIKAYEKNGVLSYDVSVEQVNNYYNIVFYKPLVLKGYRQSPRPLYMIYPRKTFDRIKRNLENEVLDLCVENNWPIQLTELLYVLSSKDVALMNQMIQEIEKSRVGGDMKSLEQSMTYNILASNLKRDEQLYSSIRDYVEQRDDDIQYSFKKKY